MSISCSSGDRIDRQAAGKIAKYMHGAPCVGSATPRRVARAVPPYPSVRDAVPLRCATLLRCPATQVDRPRRQCRGVRRIATHPCVACVPASASMPRRSLHAAHPCSAADQPGRQCPGVRAGRLTFSQPPSIPRSPPHTPLVPVDVSRYTSIPPSFRRNRYRCSASAVGWNPNF